MNILAINTAFSESYVAVISGENKVLKQMNSSLKQSENILGLIDQTLNEANVELKNLNSIACVIGPGSFTGIRIGASIAKGFAFACNTVKRISINSLDLLAFSYAKNAIGDFWAVLNALSGNLFACKYSKDGNQLIEPFLANDQNLAEINGTVVGLKEEGLEICTDYISFSSEALLEYAIMQEKNCNYATDFIPLYLRKSQAEAELDKKQNKGN